MTSYSLSTLRSLRAANAGVPRALEIEAVIETITEGWDLMSVCATAARGVSDADQRTHDRR